MKFDLMELALVIAVFFMVLAFGVIWIKALPFGYTESALLYLAAIRRKCFLGRPKSTDHLRTFG